MTLISASRIRSAIDETEADLNWCWDLLSRIRTHDLSGDIGSDILHFQPRLLKVLVRQANLYNEITRGKRFLVSRKSHYKTSWFRARMKALERYRQAVRRSIGISQVLGDAFCWFFYQKERRLIDEHMKHPRHFLLPPGVGGLGERIFIEKLQGLHDQFVLYHGLSTFLRLGDISLIDLREMRVSAIGEIKTAQIGKNEYHITLSYIGDKKYKNTFQQDFPTVKTTLSDTLPSDIYQKLKKQITTMSRSIKRSIGPDKTYTQSIHSTSLFRSLNNICAKIAVSDISYEIAESSRLLFAIKVRNNKLSSKMLPKQPADYTNRLDVLDGPAREIMHPQSSDNAIVITSIAFDEDDLPFAIPGMLPVFWWPMDLLYLYKIIFGEIIVFSIHNPAHLWEKLRARGFELDLGPRASLDKLRRRNDDSVVEMGNMQQIEALSQCCLIDDDTIVSLIEGAFNDAFQGRRESAARINLFKSKP